MDEPDRKAKPARKKTRKPAKKTTRRTWGARSSGDVLLTGATGFIGRRLAAAVAARGRRPWLLVRPGSTHKLAEVARRMPDKAPAPEVVEGDLRLDDLGLGSDAHRRLAVNVTEVFHLGAVYDLGMEEPEAMAVNVEGTRRMLALAAGLPRLRRFHHVSTLAVSGDHQHGFSEDDLDVGQAFDYPYARSKFLAEKLVREKAGDLPVTIYRPGVVVGDSRTGEMDKLDGPYFLFQVLRGLRRIPGARRLPMIVPRETDAYIHLVPVDYVVSSLDALAARTDSAGRTYHLMDPAPLTYRDFYLATLRVMGYEGPVISRPVARLVRLLHSKSLWGPTRAAARRLGMPAELMLHYLYRVTYDTTNTRTALEGTGITCPRIEDHLPRLVAYFEQHLA